MYLLQQVRENFLARSTVASYMLIRTIKQASTIPLGHWSIGSSTVTLRKTSLLGGQSTMYDALQL